MHYVVYYDDQPRHSQYTPPAGSQYCELLPTGGMVMVWLMPKSAPPVACSCGAQVVPSGGAVENCNATVGAGTAKVFTTCRRTKKPADIDATGAVNAYSARWPVASAEFWSTTPSVSGLVSPGVGTGVTLLGTRMGATTREDVDVALQERGKWGSRAWIGESVYAARGASTCTRA